MDAVTCPHCHAPVPAGAGFCGNCGTRVGQAGFDPTTRITPPPAPSATPLEANAPSVDPYAAQYPARPEVPAQPWAGQPSLPPRQELGWNIPPTPPPVSAPPRRGRGLRLAGLLLLLLLLGGGGYLAIALFHSPFPTAGGKQGTPGGGSGATSTPTSGGGLSLPAINRQATFAGASFTIERADKARSFPEFQPSTPGDDVVKVKAQIKNQTLVTLGLFNEVHLLSPDGSSPEPADTKAAGALAGSYNPGSSAVGNWYFEVNRDQSGVGAYSLVLGGAQEVQETIPFTGSYDPSIWQWVTKPIGQSVTYQVDTNRGSVTATVVKVSTGIWTPGYQAPKEMRFLLTDLLVVSKAALPLNVTADPLKLQAPGGVPESATTNYGYFVDDILAPGASRDEGYVSFLVPPDMGDFILFFDNPDGSVAGQVDLGTL